jgi:hypothetical protein
MAVVFQHIEITTTRDDIFSQTTLQSVLTTEWHYNDTLFGHYPLSGF